ncbi:MAG: shikimate dehydrogenase [Blautia sp.]|uniref:shikimate dehydrogenase n=1 Tax=Blautia sp. TaxID=1955243 RepID=UPI00257B6380|nr:shikimate dehydrogenase [Blautia sp.]MBS5123272.1 shikimate dehydrogenase [Blautia sp.]
MGKSYQKQWTGVFGDPVDDNPTVVMEQAAFDAAGIPMEYLTIQVKRGDLQAAVQGMKAMNFTGINITMPHKGEVLQYLDEISESARIMGAVNTVYWKDGKLTGENTDGKGFLKSIQDGQVLIKGKKAVILGAGGAARAIAVELAFAGIKTVTVVNKNKAHGQSLVDIINTKTNAEGVFVPWENSVHIPEDTDILINATSVGFTDDKKPDIVYEDMKAGMTVCDVIPNKAWTGFLLEAKEKGLRTFNGLQMLVNQGAIAFELWTGEPAPVDVMREAMEKEYGVELF